MRYLCHYTNLKAAKSIIRDMSLKFGMLAYSNDPIENKESRIDLLTPDYQLSDKEEINNLNLQLNGYLRRILQIISFSMGPIKNVYDIVHDEKYLFLDNKIKGKYELSKGHIELNFKDDIDLKEDIIDYASFEYFSKRPPYYYPRMWAQYGDNHRGVCLIFNKKKLIKQIQEQTQHLYYYKCKKVTYKDFIKKDMFFYQNFNEFEKSNKIKENICNEINSLSDLIYFTKDIDWRDEREYRILLWNKPENDNFNNVFVKISNESLIGVVLGIRNKSSHLIQLSEENAIKNILKLKFAKVRYVELVRI